MTEMKMILTPPPPRSQTPCLRSYSDRCGSWSGQSRGQVEGAVYWVDKEVSLSTEAEENLEDAYSHRATTTTMRNNLYKSHVGSC